MRGREVLANEAYTRHEVTYPSGDVTVSGVLLRPRGRGPFPAVVLNHGYIEPSVYVTGQGLMREQDALARAGFVVLHTDYRGHAASDPASDEARETRLGYTRDTMNAVASLKRLDAVDPDRVALLGRSMGGGVTYNALVAKPGFVRAAVVFAPVSSDFVDNLRPVDRARAAGGGRRVLPPARHPEAGAGLLPRPLGPHVLRPDHRAGPDPPRDLRRHVPDRLVPDDAAAAPARRGRLTAARVPGRAARLRPAVAALDGSDGAVPASRDAA